MKKSHVNYYRKNVNCYKMLGRLLALYLVHSAALDACGQMSQGWVGSISGNPTLVVLIPGHHDVTTHPPVSAPTAASTDKSNSLSVRSQTETGDTPVLEQPVISATVCAISYDDHSTSERGAGTTRQVVHARGVVLQEEQSG